MKTRNTLLKPATMVLTLLIILTVMPFGTTVANAEQVTPGVTVDSTASLADSTIITDNRVRAEEGDSLNTIVIDNGDGTHTMTLYDHPVKFINQDGKTEDISLEITSTDNGAYKSKANNIQTVFPQKISDGISLSGDGVNINLKPTLVTASLDKSYTKPTVSPITAAVTKIDNETVSYRYDNKTTLEYSLTYTGFKEDIVVSQYTGQTEYKFILETGGLGLTKIDESYYLTDTTGEVRATLGDIIIFTADERNNTLGSMTHITVKENQQYILTIHVDAEWLKHENTAYPIRIDPTIEITYDNNGASAIQDVTINSTAGSSGSSGSIYVGYRSNYGISRTLMKFPGLNLNNIASASNVISAYVQIRDLMCETTSMEVYGYIFAGNDWSESTATWSNVSPNSWTEMPNAYAYVSYSSGNALNPKHRYSIDITTAVKSWKTGFYSQSKGIMLRAHDSVECGDSYLYKTFASYNRASNKPSLVVNYYGPNVILLGIPDEDTNSSHDHSTVFTTITPYIQTRGLTRNIYYGDTTAATVESYLDNNQNSVFVSRSHGTKMVDDFVGNEMIVMTGIVVNSQTGEYLSNRNMISSLDLSNLKLAVFCGCETAYGGEGANNLPTVVVQKGAATAIGFTQSITCADANTWTERFFYYMSLGYSVQTACNTIKKSTDIAWVNKGTIDSVVIFGSKQTTL